MKRIYEHINNVISSITNKYDGHITAQRYEENEPGNVGVILISSRSDEECISGETMWEAMKLELHITCKNDATDIFENMNFLRKFVEAFEECNSTVDGLDILWAHHLGAKARPTYTNGYGLQVCKCIIDFNYQFDD